MSLSRKKNMDKTSSNIAQAAATFGRNSHSFFWNTKTHTRWWFQPLWNILVKIGSFPQVGVKIKRNLKPPTWTIHRVQCSERPKKNRHPASLLFLEGRIFCQVSGARLPLAAKRCKPGTWTLDGCCFCGPFGSVIFLKREYLKKVWKCYM